MKCIQAIKSTKNFDVETILRLEDKEADFKVKEGYWKYVSKSEWKKLKPNPVQKTKEESEKKEKTQSNKSLNRSKLKEKQRQ